ncbi:MAG TPA: hypothetical protein VEQ63_01895 [Bryobacteraceae bacterium]|nr:hypothetical protein [Bryobacteraceae bacterium]
MHSGAQAFAITGLALLLTGCEELVMGHSSRFREDFHIAQPFKPGSQLSIENANGSIEIVSWDKSEIDISGTKFANSESALKAVKIDVTPSAGGIRVRTLTPSGQWGNWGAKYIVSVPRRVSLERITSSNGSIRVTSVEGSATLRTSNGSVKLQDVRGDVEVSTSNGSVEADGHHGTLIARTSNGGVRADGIEGHFEASTSNGSVTASLADPQQGKPVRINTSNGSVNLSFSKLRDNDVHVSTTNSSVTLELPSSAKALVKASTSHSSIQSELDLQVRSGEMGKNFVEGTLNGGSAPRIELMTSNGNIKLLRAN